jgi:hypothetical protein
LRHGTVTERLAHVGCVALLGMCAVK